MDDIDDIIHELAEFDRHEALFMRNLLEQTLGSGVYESLQHLAGLQHGRRMRVEKLLDLHRKDCKDETCARLDAVAEEMKTAPGSPDAPPIAARQPGVLAA